MDIERRKFRWLGFVTRMDKTKVAKKLLESKPAGRGKWKVQDGENYLG
jgi:hypothetical protein